MAQESQAKAQIINKAFENQYDQRIEEDRDYGKKKKYSEVQGLKSVDHSLIEYIHVDKNFYHSEIRHKKVTEMEVHEVVKYR